MTIGIVDIGVGNIGSLQGALYSEGWDALLVTNPVELSKCSRLILPGVGSFYEGMRRLDACQLTDAIRSFASDGNPVLGICLGMQLLADYGEEGGGRDGIALIPGHVNRLPTSADFRLPHVGWNTMKAVRQHALLEGIKEGVDFYFVHSYFFDQTFDDDQIGITEYKVPFTSFVGKKNVVGLQFHPEKSQRNGLKLLDNFCQWDGYA